MDEGSSVKTDMIAGFPAVKRLSRVVAIAVVAMYALSGIYVVQPDERGVVKRFGRVVADDLAPGIHYRLPWPIDSVEKPQVTAIKRMSIGYRIVDQVRGIAPESSEVQFLSGDENIIEAQLLIQYVVKDASSYLYAVEDPHWLVRRAGECALTEKIATLGVDEILTTAKFEIERAVKGGAQEVLDSYGAGIEIAAAHLQDVSPPREVADAFRDVASAREDKNRIIHEANGYLNRVVPTARGEAEQMVIMARGYKSEKIDGARGRAGRFATMLAEYRKTKDATRTRIYLEAMEEALARVTKYVLDEEAGEGVLDVRFLSPRK